MGSCEHGGERSGSIKFWKYPEQMNNYLLLTRAQLHGVIINQNFSTSGYLQTQATKVYIIFWYFQTYKPPWNEKKNFGHESRRGSYKLLKIKLVALEALNFLSKLLKIKIPYPFVCTCSQNLLPSVNPEYKTNEHCSSPGWGTRLSAWYVPPAKPVLYFLLQRVYKHAITINNLNPDTH